MRVALACHNFPPEFQGGTERVVLALARALHAAGDDVLVLAGSDLPWDGRDVIEESGEGWRVLRLRRKPSEGYGLVVRNLRIRDLIGDLLRTEGREVLHIHHWSTLSGQLARKARAGGVGVVATLHDHWTSCARFFRRPPTGIVCPTAAGRDACGPCAALSLQAPLPSLVRGLRHRDREMQRELAAVQVLTAPSRFCADAVCSHVPWPGPIEVVPHGLLESTSGSMAAPFDGRGPLRVGTFGNLVAEKGVAELVEACAGIAGIELHLAGPFLDAAFGTRVRARARDLGVVLQVRGAFVPGADHPALGLHLAVFPSLCQETYGLVVDEALAHGVPVVVSQLGALAERIGSGGLAVAPTVEGLREAIGGLAKDAGRLAGLRRGIAAHPTTIADAAATYRTMYARVIGG